MPGLKYTHTYLGTLLVTGYIWLWRLHFYLTYKYLFFIRPLNFLGSSVGKYIEFRGSILAYPKKHLVTVSNRDNERNLLAKRFKVWNDETLTVSLMLGTLEWAVKHISDGFREPGLGTQDSICLTKNKLLLDEPDINIWVYECNPFL